jgi:hypothetical protein
MNGNVVLLLMILAGGTVVADRAQEGERDDPVPVYRTLYEEGFYQEAITVLDSLSAADSGCSVDLLQYLAYCHIARGDRTTGEQVFERLLGCDPHYRCDTLFTSPKILAVFSAALTRYSDLQQKTDAAASADSNKVSAPVPAAATPDAPVTQPANRAAAHTGLLPAPDSAGRSVAGSSRGSLLRRVPGLLPGAAGQFTQRQWVKGMLLLAVQAAAMGGYVWAYHTRQSYYDPVYGWYPPVNEAAYKRYTAYARVGCTVFIGAYTFSVIDYFHRQRKQSTLH